MKITAAVSRGATDAPALEQLELEEPRAGEMRIRLVATGICHTDLHEHPGRHSPHPIVLGHEGAGVVEKLGEGVTGFAVGAVPWLLVLFGVGLFVGNVAGGRAADRDLVRTLLVVLAALTVVLAAFALTAGSKPLTVLALLLMGGVGFATVPGL